MSPISRIPKTAVPAVKDAVSPSTPAKPNPVTNGTIPGKVREDLAKVPTAFALQQFPGISVEAKYNVPRAVNEVLGEQLYCANERASQALSLAQGGDWLGGLNGLNDAMAVRQRIASQLPPAQRQILEQAIAEEQRGYNLLRASVLAPAEPEAGMHLIQDAEEKFLQIEKLLAPDYRRHAEMVKEAMANIR